MVRAELEEPGPDGAWQASGEARRALIESEISARGRGRVLLNRQSGARRRDVAGVGRVTVFSPDDLVLIKGGPSERRGLLDDALVARDPRLDAARADYDKVLRQRNALLRQSKGSLDEAAKLTLEVWNAQLVDRGTRLGDERASLCAELSPLVRWRSGRPVATSCGGASRSLGRTETSFRSIWSRWRRAPMLPRVSSAAWPCRCAWRFTGY